MRPISGSQEPLQKGELGQNLNWMWNKSYNIYTLEIIYWYIPASFEVLDVVVGELTDTWLTSLWLQASWSYESWLMTMCPTTLTSPSWKPCNKSRRLNYHLIMTERAGSNILCWSYNENDNKRTFSPFGADGNKCKGACTDRCRLDKAGNIEIFIVVIVCTTRVHKCLK